MGRLDDKKAVVTGAAQGLGAAILERLAREGCDAVGWDLNGDALEATTRAIAARTGRRITGAAVDVTDAAGVRNTMDAAVTELGRLDICVANAGILISGDATAFDASRWRRVIDVNLVGYFLTAREAARVMLDGGGGSIIQINSKSGKTGSFHNSAYVASKFGGIGVTQSLALEFATQRVRVNAVCPGNLLDSPLWIESLFRQYARNQGISEEEVRRRYIEKVPMKRPCTYDDVTNVVVFLASDESSYMTGQAINVTGGQEMH
ncbi:MAG TPA: sorbitol-6-phosphate dehydrogenase [Candidatus Hydrogenedentes bacterium]|nr:sorbitol-6-phosphate dehydrogenase [Candidatus Hydrogenedentota bacterium]HIJ72656.1 sorbitol-6-phosphate dehydrogenase [Candidatus Hydrogenedentota bacterium]